MPVIGRRRPTEHYRRGAGRSHGQLCGCPRRRRCFFNGDGQPEAIGVAGRVILVVVVHPEGVIGWLQCGGGCSAEDAGVAVERQAFRQGRIEAVVAEFAVVEAVVDVAAGGPGQGERLDGLAGSEHQIADAGVARETRAAVLHRWWWRRRPVSRHLIGPVAAPVQPRRPDRIAIVGS